MTVSELTALLSKMPADTVVYADDGDGGRDVEAVEIQRWDRWPSLNVNGFTRSRTYAGPPQPMSAVVLKVV